MLARLTFHAHFPPRPTCESKEAIHPTSRPASEPSFHFHGWLRSRHTRARERAGERVSRFYFRRQQRDDSYYFASDYYVFPRMGKSSFLPKAPGRAGGGSFHREPAATTVKAKPLAISDQSSIGTITSCESNSQSRATARPRDGEESGKEAAGGRYRRGEGDGAFLFP